MKKIMVSIIAVLLILSLSACSTAQKTESADKSETTETVVEQSQATTETSAEVSGEESSEATVEDSIEETSALEESSETEEEPADENSSVHSDILVVYFSATGTTKGVAEKIAALTGADLYEITAAEPYTAEDLDYNDRSSRSTREQNDPDARPQIGSEPIDLTGYTTIYIGFPIWWGEEPRIMDTFVESYNFEGITMIPFCTSASSGIGNSGPNMESLAGTGNWIDGERFGARVSEEDLQDWIDSLN